MNISVHTIASALHDEVRVNEAVTAFITRIEKVLESPLTLCGPEFSAYGQADLDLIYVCTGGTEGRFKELLPGLDGKIYLLTSGDSNSLAASLEILSYLNQNGRSGEIIHGSDEYVAGRIAVLAKVSAARKSLKGANLGVVGAPSDWLIASEMDRVAVAKKLGINFVDVPVQELIDIYKALENGTDTALAGAVSSDSAEAQKQDAAQAQKQDTAEGQKCDAAEVVKNDVSGVAAKYAEGAIRIYKALKVLVEKYQLSGLTLRCFDLLDTLGNTGCLALAILNAEGIPAGCEGDVPTLVTMTIGNALTGQCGFQANPSRIDPEVGEMLLAHCTVPFNMILKHSYNTHFESGIGVAIHGELPTGPATICKVSTDLSRSFCAKAELTSNPYESNLCRTQIVMKLQGDAQQSPQSICRDYFLRAPIGNHHVVFTGDNAALFTAFIESL